MEGDVVVEQLNEAGIRPTATRILIYRFIMGLKDTFSLRDIDEGLLSIDKSTIFRTLILFEEHHLVHGIDDGSGAMKYCLCRNHGECDEQRLHCHFYCVVCKKTHCLDNIITLNMSLPEGFKMEQLSCVIKGTCDKCSASGRR